MTKTGVTHTDTAQGKGGGQLTENPSKDEPKKPAPFSGKKPDGTEGAKSGKG